MAAIYRRSLLWQRLPLKKYLVAEFRGQGIDLFDDNTEHELANEAGEKIAPHIAIKVNATIESRLAFMEIVDRDVARLAKVEGVGGVQLTTTIGGSIGTVLQTIVPIIDNFANTHPVLHLVWIVLSSAYKVMQKQVVTDDAVRDLAEHLREMVGAASTCPNLLEIEGTSNVIDEIGRTSLDTALLIHEYTDPSVKGKASIFEKAIHKWMAAPDSSANYKDAREKHKQGTGSWLVDGDDFQRWKDCSGSVLWLHGGPGCGKTILISSAIDVVKNICKDRPLVGYAYFFFDGTNSQSNLAAYESLIQSFIVQFSEQFDGIPPALESLYNEHNGRSRPLITSLQETLLQMITYFTASYIIIDALDECAERPKVLEWIRSITSQNLGGLHLMFTSRPEPDIKSSSLYVSLQKVDFKNRKASVDIHRYIEARLATMDKWTEPQKEKVRTVLRKGADGVFRWVTLQLNELERCVNTLELEQRLESLPQDLDEAYTEIIKQSPRPFDLIMFLQWITFAHRAFTAQELADIACINFGSGSDSLPFYDPGRRYASPDDVLNTCYGLVIEVEDIIKIAHFSVKEFLLEKRIQIGPNVIHINESISHCNIAKACLVYISRFNELDSINQDNIETSPLTLYAANYSVAHVQAIRAQDMDLTLKHLIQHLVVPRTSRALISWYRLRSSGGSINTPQTQENGSPPLYYASYIGLIQLVDYLIAQGADLNALGGKWGTALHAALQEDHFEIVKLLLENGADANVMAGQETSALQVALSKDHINIEIIKLLLETGADVNAAGGMYDNALQAAANCGSLEITKLLLERGADVNKAGGEYGTVLQAASNHGSLEVVGLLLENGAKVNQTGGKFYTALQAASNQGSLEIVRLLLKNGAEVNDSGGAHGTALQAARFMGHLSVVEMLLGKGALDETTASGQYKTVILKDLTKEVKLDAEYFAYGAYSEVYRGTLTNPTTGETIQVAVKALRGVTNDPQKLIKIKRRLLREIQVWMPLKHPNITPFLGVVEGLGPLSATVSPYCWKGNISQYIIDNPEKDRLQLITGVASGLAYLHSLDLLHGDLKGHNVLIDDEGSPRVIDFGKSRVVERRGFTTAFTGTARYMAPELTVISDDILKPAPSPDDEGSDASPATLDPMITKQSDVYAFSMVVLEILTSKLPFFYLRQEHLVVILTQDGKRPDRQRCAPTQFADDMWKFMEDCWNHDQSKRPVMAATIPRLQEMQVNHLRVAWDEPDPPIE
ncbi:hypothetical protein HWV62_5427 [Athelia sp. TMB]|nr:hypothetical protein HWV62_5427 [Athelia sp. TMB]